jgi:hypothetical protein
MNPGLIPPADVAAAAKKGLELREKFHRGGTSVGVHRAKQRAERRDVSLRDIGSPEANRGGIIAAARGPRRRRP